MSCRQLHKQDCLQIQKGLERANGLFFVTHLHHEKAGSGEDVELFLLSRI